MRLIDADALVKEAERLYGEWNKAMAGAEGTRQINKVYKMQELSKAVAEVARNMTTYVPSPCETHWIPCSERLPEMHEENDYTGRYEESNLVLICDASELHPQVHVGLCWKLEGRVGWRTREWKVLDKVTAWMPLPETYKEKNEDDE